MDIEILEGYNHEMGIEMLADGFVASAISHGARCSMVLYERNVKNAVKVLDFPLEYRMGDVWNMRVKVDDIKALKQWNMPSLTASTYLQIPVERAFLEETHGEN